MFQNALNTTKGGNDINSIIVELPEFTIMPLRSPPERIALGLIN